MKMEDKLLAQGTVLGLLIMLMGAIMSGCTPSSYTSCTWDCSQIYVDDFKYIGTCCAEWQKLNPNAKEIECWECERINYTARDEFCYKECKSEGEE